MALVLIVLGIFIMWAVFTGKWQTLWSLSFSGAGKQA